MPQLQEGDEIVHINGRIVKELPHQEVLCSMIHAICFNSRVEILTLLAIHLSNGTCENLRVYQNHPNYFRDSLHCSFDIR